MPLPEPSPAPPALVPASSPVVEAGDARVPLRLTVTRGALGIELYEPVEIGPLEVRHLASTLPGLKFPLDVTGGVPVFRHRRGDLEELELAASLHGIARWLAPRLGEAFGVFERPLSAWSVPDGIALGLCGSRGALAFELLWVPYERDARFVVVNARGARLDGPALGDALRIVDTAFGEIGERRGRVVTLPRAVARLTRAVLPAIGARAPATERVRFGLLEADGDEVVLRVDAAFDPPALHATAARALELAELTAAADDALARGELETARAEYLTALERAPRHPEVARLIAEIDVCAGGRIEAALGMVVEILPATAAGWVGCELLARSGDADGAREAAAELGRNEVYAPLAALAWHRLSELEDLASDRMTALDRAVAAAPALASVRWARFAARVGLGDVEGALGDAEHLEAAASGAAVRHGICVRAARALLERGFVRDAGRLFERALRYLPDDAAATAGLARALMEAGKSERAFALLSRAVALSERRGRTDAEALIDMAKLLATDMRDLPQAIARIRQVPSSSARAAEAKAMEAAWRATLGDVAGASLAHARMRDLVQLAERAPEGAVGWLMHAARFEREVVRDVLAAERHLAVALRASPHDRGVVEAYREVGAVVAARLRRERDRSDADGSRVAPLDTLAPPPPAPAEDDASGPSLETLPPPAPLPEIDDSVDE